MPKTLALSLKASESYRPACERAAALHSARLGADDAGVRLIDNAGPLAGQIQTVPLLDFLARWTGYAVIVYPAGAGPLPFYGGD